MQIGQELLPRRAGPRAGRAQVDRDADLRGLKIIQAIGLRTPTAQQVIDIPSTLARSSPFRPVNQCRQPPAPTSSRIQIAGSASTDRQSTRAATSAAPRWEFRGRGDTATTLYR